jgi:hypothetical protein
MNGSGRVDTAEAGMTTVQYVLGAALSMLVFVVMANFIVFLYARGVVRAAVDEGARAGGRSGSTTGDCEARASAVVGDLLGGALGDDVHLTCRHDAGSMHADAAVTLHAWLPIVPDWTFTLGARANREDA